MFEDNRHERSLILLFSITDPDLLRQCKLTEYDIDITENKALEILHRQRILKERVAMSLLESQLQ